MTGQFELIVRERGSLINTFRYDDAQQADRQWHADGRCYTYNANGALQACRQAQDAWSRSEQFAGMPLDVHRVDHVDGRETRENLN
jgi:hypothetical protein